MLTGKPHSGATDPLQVSGTEKTSTTKNVSGLFGNVLNANADGSTLLTRENNLMRNVQNVDRHQTMPLTVEDRQHQDNGIRRDYGSDQFQEPLREDVEYFHNLFENGLENSNKTIGKRRRYSIVHDSHLGKMGVKFAEGEPIGNSLEHTKKTVGERYQYGNVLDDLGKMGVKFEEGEAIGNSLEHTNTAIGERYQYMNVLDDLGKTEAKFAEGEPNGKSLEHTKKTIDERYHYGNILDDLGKTRPKFERSDTTKVETRTRSEDADFAFTVGFSIIKSSTPTANKANRKDTNRRKSRSKRLAVNVQLNTNIHDETKETANIDEPRLRPAQEDGHLRAHIITKRASVTDPNSDSTQEKDSLKAQNVTAKTDMTEPGLDRIPEEKYLNTENFPENIKFNEPDFDPTTDEGHRNSDNVTENVNTAESNLDPTSKEGSLNSENVTEEFLNQGNYTGIPSNPAEVGIYPDHNGVSPLPPSEPKMAGFIPTLPIERLKNPVNMEGAALPSLQESVSVGFTLNLPNENLTTDPLSAAPNFQELEAGGFTLSTPKEGELNDPMNVGGKSTTNIPNGHEQTDQGNTPGTSPLNPSNFDFTQNLPAGDSPLSSLNISREAFPSPPDDGAFKPNIPKENGLIITSVTPPLYPHQLDSTQNHTAGDGPRGSMNTTGAAFPNPPEDADFTSDIPKGDGLIDLVTTPVNPAFPNPPEDADFTPSIPKGDGLIDLVITPGNPAFPDPPEDADFTPNIPKEDGLVITPGTPALNPPQLDSIQNPPAGDGLLGPMNTSEQSLANATQGGLPPKPDDLGPLPGLEPPTEGQGQPGLEPPTEGQGPPGLDLPTEGQGLPGLEPPTEGQGPPGLEPPTEGQGQPGLEPPTEGQGQPGLEPPTEGQGPPGPPGMTETESAIKRVLTSTTLVISVSGFALNTPSLVVFWRSPHSVTNSLMIGLLGIETLALFVSFPFWTYDAAVSQTAVMFGPLPFMYFRFVAELCLITALRRTIYWLTAYMTMDRVLVLAYPLLMRGRNLIRKPRIVISVILSVTCVYTAIETYFRWEVKEVSDPILNATIGIIFPSDSFRTDLKMLYFLIATNIIFQYVPGLTLIVANFGLLFILARHEKALSGTRARNVTSVPFQRRSNPTHSVALIFVYSILTLALFLPLEIYMSKDVFSLIDSWQTDDFDPIKPGTPLIPQIVACVNAFSWSVDFFVFFAVSSSFRSGMKKLLGVQRERVDTSFKAQSTRRSAVSNTR